MILHSCTSKSFSGLERYVFSLVQWQKKQGYPILLFCRESTELSRLAQEQDIPLVTIDRNQRVGIKTWLQLASVCKELDILHMHAGGEPWFHLPRLLKRKYRKSILQYHIWINHKKKDPLHWLLYSRIHEFWVSTNSAQINLEKLLPISKDKFRVVPYGRDIKSLAELNQEKWSYEIRSELGMQTNESLAVCLSRIESIKGVLELFLAFIEVAENLPRVHLAIVGDPSPDDCSAEQLDKKIKILHSELKPDVKNRIHLTGYRQDGLKFIAAADFYVLPSYEECMSLAMLDAMLLGRPVIATDSGGTPSVVKSGKTGLLIPPQNVLELKNALERLFLDPAYCKLLGRNAKAFALKNFDQEEIFTQITKSYLQ